jgi:hypothetical protein
VYLVFLVDGRRLTRVTVARRQPRQRREVAEPQHHHSLVAVGPQYRRIVVAERSVEPGRSFQQFERSHKNLELPPRLQI